MDEQMNEVSMNLQCFFIEKGKPFIWCGLKFSVFLCLAWFKFPEPFPEESRRLGLHSCVSFLSLLP